jgi:hypothetical protein
MNSFSRNILRKSQKKACARKIQGASKNVVISKCHMLHVIAPVLLSYKRNVLWFQEIKFIAIILSIKDINMNFYTSRAPFGAHKIYYTQNNRNNLNFMAPYKIVLAA